MALLELKIHIQIIESTEIDNVTSESVVNEAEALMSCPEGLRSWPLQYIVDWTRNLVMAGFSR